MIRLVLVDDEINSLKSIEWELTNFSKDVEIVASFTNPEEAISYLRKNEVDCVFVDIEMPQMDGFQFLRNFTNRDFIAVIVTAYSQYALQAIKEQAFDYLLKPVDLEDLNLTLNKIKIKLNENELKKALLPQVANKKIALNYNGKILYLKPDEIIYCESDGNYTQLFLKDNQMLLITKKIKEIHELLNLEIFVRVHNSFIININWVKEFLRAENYIVLENGKQIPISRNKRDLFLGI